MSIRQALIELESTVRKSQDLECNGWPLQRWCRKQRIRREVLGDWNRTGLACSVVLVPIKGETGDTVLKISALFVIRRLSRLALMRLRKRRVLRRWNAANRGRSPTL